MFMMSSESGEAREARPTGQLREWSEIATGLGAALLPGVEATSGATTLQTTDAVTRDVDRLDDTGRRSSTCVAKRDELPGACVARDFVGRHGAPHRSFPALNSGTATTTASRLLPKNASAV